MKRTGEDPPLDQNGAPAGMMTQQQGADSNLFPTSGFDSQHQHRPNSPNTSAASNAASLAFGGFSGVVQGQTGNVNPNQYLEDQQRRLMLLDQAQTNQRNMLLRQSDYGHMGGQLAASRNAFMNQQMVNQQTMVNQQMLLNQGNVHPFMMEPLLSATGSQPQMGSNMNPEMFFAAASGGAGGNLCLPQGSSLPSQGASLPGLIPQHSVGNFSGGGLAPSMQLHGMNMGPMSSFLQGNSGTDMSAVLEATSQGRAGLPTFPRSQEKKEAPDRDMPVRPLSAYNFFFRDERERILQEGDETKEEASRSPESLEKKKRKLLDQHILRDRTRRRPHRKTHGKIGFTTLSKLIGKRWRELPDEEKQFYRDVAAMDMDRYQRDVNEYNKGRLFQMKQAK